MKGIIYLFGGRFYDLFDEYFEKTRYRKIRKKMLENLKGKILDAGCGTGRNFPYYSNKARVFAIDNSEPMLRKARKRAVNLENIKIFHGDLTKLGFPDNHFDATVATFVLCIIPEKLK